MAKSKDITPFWVHNDFQRMIKAESAKRGMKIIEFTKKLAEENDKEVVDSIKDKKERGFRFGFNL